MGKKIKNQPQVKLEHIEQLSKTQNKPADKTVKKQNLSTTLQNTSKDTKVKYENKSEKQLENQNNSNKIQSKTKKIRHARLIIRNLVFDINEKHIKKLISPFGQIKQINIPKHPDKNQSRGFAFVQMNNKNQCLKAIKQLNGTQYKGRPIVLDLAVSKQNFMTEKLNDDDNKDVKKQVKEEKQEQNEQKISQQQNQKEIDEQDPAQSQNKMQQQQNEESSEEAQDKVEKQKQDHLHEVFIRNLPISTTQNQLFKHFSKLGKIYFVRICKNKETNLSKGTAFIKFHSQQVAQKLIQYSRTYQMFLLKKLKHFVPDPTIKLQIDGVIMKIFPVQSRKQITDKLKQRQGQNKTTNKTIKSMKKIKKIQDLIKTDIHDKRKLSLSLLGFWKATQEMNKYDYQFFKNHERQKVEKLKNPNAQVSSTRIILKHLQKTITQQDIKTVCLKFLHDRNLKHSQLTYCKLMLEKDMKKSAGFAFLQFQKHETAKQFIQMLTNQPNIIQNKLFIVQFAIQDSRKLLKLSRNNNKIKIETKSKDKEKQKMGKKKKINKNKPKDKNRKFKRKIIKK